MNVDKCTWMWKDLFWKEKKSMSDEISYLNLWIKIIPTPIHCSKYAFIVNLVYVYLIYF